MPQQNHAVNVETRMKCIRRPKLTSSSSAAAAAAEFICHERNYNVNMNVK